MLNLFICSPFEESRTISLWWIVTQFDAIAVSRAIMDLAGQYIDFTKNPEQYDQYYCILLEHLGNFQMWLLDFCDAYEELIYRSGFADFV